MIVILSGTNRPGSNTLKVTARVEAAYRVLGVKTHLLDLAELSGSSLEQALGRTPGVGVPFERRIRFVDRALAALSARGTAVPLRELARELHAEPQQDAA